MFNWFAPRCPIDLRERVLVERNLGRLAAALRIDFARPRDVITPDDFAALIESDRLTPAAIARRVLENIGASPDETSGGYLDLPPGARKWGGSESNDKRSDGDAALVAFTTTSVVSSYLESHAASIGSLAGAPYIVESGAVLFGAGVYPANQTVHESYTTNGLWFTWRMSQSGGMPSVLFGYAFAVDAWMRSEELPDWSRFLRRDARETFSAGLRFLKKRGSELLSHTRRARFERDPRADQVAEDLHSRDPACRVNGLFDVSQFRCADTAVLDAIADCLRDDVPEVAMSACEAAASLGETAAPLFDDVARSSESDSASVRALVADAIGGMQVDGHEAISVLERLVEDAGQSVSLAAIRALLRLPAGMETGLELSVARLERTILTSNLSAAAFLLGLLSERVDDPAGFVKGRLWERLDAEGRGVLEEELARIACEESAG